MTYQINISIVTLTDNFDECVLMHFFSTLPLVSLCHCNSVRKLRYLGCIDILKGLPVTPV